MAFKKLARKPEVLIALAIVFVGLVAGAYIVWQRSAGVTEKTNINSFQECAKAGYPIMESYPEQCRANGQTFTNESQEIVETPKTDEPVDASSGWLLYEPPRKEYSIRIPDGWVVHRYQQESGLFSEETVYDEGVTAKIIEDEGGRDFANLPFGLNYFNKEDAPEPTGTKMKTFHTAQGVEVTVYSSEQTDDPEGIGPPAGTTSYHYWVTKGGAVIYITHDVLPTETAQTELIEKAILTLRIK